MAIQYEQQPQAPPHLERTEAVVRKLTNPTEEEIDKATDVIMAAFGDDPFVPHLVGGQLPLLRSHFRANVAAAACEGTILAAVPARNEDSSSPREDEYAGVMVFFDPGTSLNATQAQREKGWDQFMEQAGEGVRAWWSDYWLPLLGKTCTQAFGDGGALRAWDLHLFGVRPSYHGQGVGSKMMNYAKAMAKETNSPIVLETQNLKNVAMYQKWGFELKAEIEIEEGRVLEKTREVARVRKERGEGDGKVPRGFWFLVWGL